MTLQEAMQDKDFQALPLEEKRKALSSIDKDYAALPQTEQYLAIGKMAKTGTESGFLESPQGPTYLSQDRPIRQALSRIYTPVLEALGMGVGGVVGTGLEPGAGTGIGAGFGYAGGRALSEGINEAIGLPPRETVLERIGRIPSDIRSGMTMEALGTVPGRLLSGVMAPEAGSMTPESRELMNLSEEYGVPMTSAEIKNRAPGAKFQKFLEWAPGSSGVMQKHGEEQLNAMMKIRENMIAKGGPPEQIERLGNFIREQAESSLAGNEKAKAEVLSRLKDQGVGRVGQRGVSAPSETVGENVQERVVKKSQEVFKQAGEKYQKVRDLIPQGTKIDTPSLQKTAKAVLDEQLALPVAQQDRKLIGLAQELSGASKDIQKYIDALAPGSEKLAEQIRQSFKDEIGFKPTWEGLQGLRSNLGQSAAAEDAAMRAGQPGAKFFSSKEGGAYKRLKKAVDQDITAFSERSGGEIKTAFDEANQFYRSAKQVYGSPDMLRLLKSNPERVVDQVIRPGRVTEIKMLKDAIGEDGFKPVKEKFVSKLMRLEKDDTFNPKHLADDLKKYGNETLSAVFTKPELETLQSIAQRGLKVSEQQLGDPIVKTIAKMSPEKIFDTMIKQAPRKGGEAIDVANVRNIDTLQKLIGSEGMDRVKSKLMERILEKNKVGNFSPKLFVDNLLSYGPQTMQRMFKPGEITEMINLRKLAQAAMASERLAANPSGTAQGLISEKSFGTIIRNPLSAGKEVTYLLTTKGLAKLYLSPAGRKYLTVGYQLPASTQAAIDNVTKLLEVAGKDGYERMNDK